METSADIHLYQGRNHTYAKPEMYARVTYTAGWRKQDDGTFRPWLDTTTVGPGTCHEVFTGVGVFVTIMEEMTRKLDQLRKEGKL